MEINELKLEIDGMFSQAKQDKRDADFYRRVLVQVILTYGQDGFLPISYSLADEAKATATNCRIEFGDGGVQFVRPTTELTGSSSAGG